MISTSCRLSIKLVLWMYPINGALLARMSYMDSRSVDDSLFRLLRAVCRAIGGDPIFSTSSCPSPPVSDVLDEMVDVPDAYPT